MPKVLPNFNHAMNSRETNRLPLFPRFLPPLPPFWLLLLALLLPVLAALVVLLALLAALAAVALLVLALELLFAFALPLLLLAPPVVTVNLLQSSWAPRCASYDGCRQQEELMTTWNLIDLPAW